MFLKHIYVLIVLEIVCLIYFFHVYITSFHIEISDNNKAIMFERVVIKTFAYFII